MASRSRPPKEVSRTEKRKRAAASLDGKAKKIHAASRLIGIGMAGVLFLPG